MLGLPWTPPELITDRHALNREKWYSSDQNHKISLKSSHNLLLKILSLEQSCRMESYNCSNMEDLEDKAFHFRSSCHQIQNKFWKKKNQKKSYARNSTLWQCLSHRISTITLSFQNVLNYWVHLFVLSCRRGVTMDDLCYTYSTYQWDREVLCMQCGKNSSRTLSV